ncbi:kynureninase [Candidatus Gracilibacteria bacterium]|nr:kynureninase [Candidatus Gracilibacteria bacterium]
MLYIILGIFIGFALPPTPKDSNSRIMYGDTGLPKNCRAIITANITAFQNNEYSAEDTLESINRNCGAEGYSWEIE